MNYDSKADTLEHIKRVQDLLTMAAIELVTRGVLHDASKLESPEKELFDLYSPLLKDLKFGSDEYIDSLDKLKVALDHHYEHNSHHPQHYKNGINDMTLFDIIEMFIDWQAASERTKNGNIIDSIELNEKRFNINPQLTGIFKNTVKFLNNETENRR